MTLEELGEVTSIGFKHIADIERGEKTPSFEAIERLAKGLNVPPFELFLPLGRSGQPLKESLKRLMKDVVDESSPATQRLLLIILALVRQSEGSRSSEAKFNLHDFLNAEGISGHSPASAGDNA